MNPNDPDVINLSKAIFQRESGGDFNAVGDAGTSHGAGQWQPGTWKAQAKDVLGDENAQMTPANQKAVIQVSIAKDKAAGLNPAQIAAKWNSGRTHDWENHVGTTTINGQQIHYDTPKYVKDVTELYQQYKNQGGQGYNPTPFSNPTTPGQFDFTGIGTQPTNTPDTSTLGGKVAGRLNDASGAISEIGQGASGILGGDLSQAHRIVSGGLQTVGAGAGAVGDIVNSGLELIPGVKQVENMIGQGVGSLMATEGGKAVAQSIKDFSEKHPELSKDIGAGFNIITALPILKGLAVIKNVAMDAGATALKDVAEKSATNGLNEIISSTAPGRKKLSFSPNGIKTLVQERALPEVENGKYTTRLASEKLDAQIAHIDEHELQPILDAGTTPGVSDRIPLATYEKNAIAEAVDNLKPTAPIKQAFSRLRSKYGDYLTAQQMNEAKRLVSKNISEAGYMSPTYSTDKIVRSTLQSAVEDWGKATGDVDIQAINAKMRDLIQAQKLLKYIEGKSVKPGLLGQAGKFAGAGIGEFVGKGTGTPFAGAYAGYKTTGMLEKAFGGHRTRDAVLKRTGKGAVKDTQKLKKGVGLLKGALAQKATQ